MNNINEIVFNYFVCPDDLSNLCLTKDRITCSNCNREFDVWDKVIEIMPSNFYSKLSAFQSHYEENYFNNYLLMFNEKFSINQNAEAWGSKEIIKEKYSARKNREINQIINGCDLNNKIVCDISSGAGWMTLNVAKTSQMVINCDISTSNINYVINKSKLMGIDNLFFIRADFFNPPFKENMFDIVFCTDTLIYGDTQVSEFLNNIFKILKRGGIAVVDFYNRLHRNPFHSPYMVGYTKKEAEMFIEKIGFRKFSYEGFYQEFKGKIARILPATRHIFYLVK